jgi:hypothetical protein
VPRSRGELLRLAALHKAAAARAEALLKDAAEHEWSEHGAAVTWRFGESRVETRISHPRPVVVDEEKLLDFLEQYTAAVTRREIREVPSAFVDAFLGSLTLVPRDDTVGGDDTLVLVDSLGREVTGVQWDEGGSLISIALNVDPEVKRQARDAVEAYVQGEAPFPI